MFQSIGPIDRFASSNATSAFPAIVLFLSYKTSIIVWPLLDRESSSSRCLTLAPLLPPAFFFEWLNGSRLFFAPSYDRRSRNYYYYSFFFFLFNIRERGGYPRFSTQQRALHKYSVQRYNYYKSSIYLI